MPGLGLPPQPGCRRGPRAPTACLGEGGRQEGWRRASPLSRAAEAGVVWDTGLRKGLQLQWRFVIKFQAGRRCGLSNLRPLAGAFAWVRVLGVVTASTPSDPEQARVPVHQGCSFTRGCWLCPGSLRTP